MGKKIMKSSVTETLSKGEKAKLQRQGVLMKEGARGLGSIDWPEEEMIQTATDAIRHGYSKNDSFSHLYSMYGDDHGKWLRANEDDILDVFSQYMDESISEANESVEDIIKRAMKELKRIDPQVMFRTRDMMKAVATIKQGNIAGALQDLVNGVDGPENQIQDTFNDAHDTLQRLINPKTDKELDDEYWADVDDMKARNRIGEEKTLQGVMSKVFDNALREFEFNPRAGHRDQPSHPENRGLTPEYPEINVRPKARPTSSAPKTSLRPKPRPANLQMRNDINKAVQQAMGEGKSPHKKGTAKYKAHMAAMHAEGYKVMPPMDPKYTERSGLEGPFTTLSGKVVYYDPKEGSYYDPDTDMYMSYDEFQAYDNDYSGMKDERDEVKEIALNQMRESLKVDRSLSDNEVVAKYTRTTLDESYDTWDKINEQVQFIISMLAEGHSADSKQVIKLLQRTNVQEQADSFLNRKYKK